MFLYTPGGRDLLRVSDSQMQSKLAEALVVVNEAMANSDIDLRFSLVRVEPVSLSLLKRAILTWNSTFILVNYCGLITSRSCRDKGNGRTEEIYEFCFRYSIA